MKETPRMIQKLLGLLKSRGYTQGAFESRMRWPQGRISKWVGGQGEPTATQMWLISKELGVSIQYLYDDTMDEPGEPMPAIAATILKVAERIGWDEALDRLLKPTVVVRDSGVSEKSIPPNILLHPQLPIEPKGRAKEERDRQHKPPKKERLPKP